MTIQTLRHHVYDKQGGPKSIELKEIGPRFELRLYKVVTISFSQLFFCLSTSSTNDIHFSVENEYAINTSTFWNLDG